MAACFVVAFVVTAATMSPSGPMRMGPRSSKVQMTHAINMQLFAYANDHDGKYPTGKSSTEIFQQLIDQEYVYDPALFYFPMPGKTKAVGKKLKPENVCFDMTDGVRVDDSDWLPVVFSTGYRIDYGRGGKAHLLENGDPDGIVVGFKNLSAAYLIAQPDGIPLFPASLGATEGGGFDPKGRTYQQLTPEGALP